MAEQKLFMKRLFFQPRSSLIKIKPWDEGFDKLTLYEGNLQVRLFGERGSWAKHWIEHYPTGKISGTKETVTVPCFCYNSTTEEFEVNNFCPACLAGFIPKRVYLTHAIDRRIENIDKEKAIVVNIPESLVDEIMNMRRENIDKTSGEEFPIWHKKFGRDLHLTLYRSRRGIPYYKAKMGNITPLTKSELSYKNYDFSTIPSVHNSQLPGSLYYKERNNLAMDLVELGFLCLNKDAVGPEDQPDTTIL